MSAQRRQLLLLAERVGTVDADLGSATAQAWLVSAVDALAHAVVDLADGKSAATIEVPVLALDPAVHDEVEADRASCAAAASDLRQGHVALTTALEAPDGIPPGLATDTVRSMSVLASALQDLAAHPSSSDHQRSVRAGAHRSIRTAYRLVQPAGSPGTSPKRA